MKITLSKFQWAEIGQKTGWIKTAQILDSVKKLDTLDDRELTRAIRDAIIAEQQAIKQYETLVDSTKNSKVKEVLTSVGNEERQHVGELQELLRELLPDEQDFLDDGAKEVKEE